MKKTIWKKNYENNFKIDESSKYDDTIARILNERNLSLNEDFNFNPFEFADMKKAVEKIDLAIKNKEKIYIYGDYDVDGITSVSLLYLGLKEIGAEVDYYIPLRDEGYGLNKEAIKNLNDEGAKLVISVDCGINSIEEIDFANELNLDFIITDHHEIIGELPKAYAIINPKREENIYEFKYLAGVGTAFMLLSAIYSQKKCLEAVEKYIDIVAIGTVADIVPLVSDNRKFVRRGLKNLNLTKWIGIKQLLRKLYPDDYESREYLAYDIGYVIAPIFNAAGRLEDAKNSVKLFIEEDAFQCLQIIEGLLENNFKRKEIQKRIFEKSVSEVEKNKLYKRNIIVVANKNFHHGVIGIVASKILDKYYKPTIIMEIKENEGIATASCRSIEGLNIVECLNSVSDILVRYGGHSGAAGFTITIDKIDEFYERIDKYIEENAYKAVFTKKIKIDEVLQPYKVNFDFLKQMKMLEPFGAKNNTPIFAFKNCTYSRLRFTKNSTEHIIFDLNKDGYIFKNCIFFNGGDYYDLMANSKNVDIAFKLKLEIFKDRYMFKLHIEDIKNSLENEEFTEGLLKFGKELKFPLETVIYTRRNDIDENISLRILDYGVDVIKDRTVVGNFDENLAKILMNLKRDFNYNFSLKLKYKYAKIENLNLHLDIMKDEIFLSYAIKDGQLFIDIKNYLIGNFNYNSVQKKVLASVFKDKKRTLLVAQEGRGINTIIDTISLYMREKKLKVSLNEVEEKADFYIFNNYQKIENIKKINSESILVITKNEIELENFNKIIDNYEIPENIKIIEYSEIKDMENTYNYFLPDQEKIKILKMIKENKRIKATEDIKIHF